MPFLFRASIKNSVLLGTLQPLLVFIIISTNFTNIAFRAQGPLENTKNQVVTKEQEMTNTPVPW